MLVKCGMFAAAECFVHVFSAMQAEEFTEYTTAY